MKMTKEQRERRKELREKFKGLPREYTEEAIIDGEKVTAIVRESPDYIRGVVRKRKSKIIRLFGREFRVPLHANITPMIVRYTGESCYSFRPGREYMVITKSREYPEEYSIVDESGDDYVNTLTNFEIVSEGDGPPPERFLDYWEWREYAEKQKKLKEKEA